MNYIAEQLIEEFLAANRTSGIYLNDRIARLAELSISTDHQIAESASKALFSHLVEPLADAFEPSAVSLYNRALAQVIHVCRKAPHSAALDRKLKEFDLTGEDDLVARAERLRQSYRTVGPREANLHVKTVIL